VRCRSMCGSGSGVGCHLGITTMVLMLLFSMLPPFRSECRADDKKANAADAQDEGKIDAGGFIWVRFQAQPAEHGPDGGQHLGAQFRSRHHDQEIIAISSVKAPLRGDQRLDASVEFQKIDVRKDRADRRALRYALSSSIHRNETTTTNDVPEFLRCAYSMLSTSAGSSWVKPQCLVKLIAVDLREFRDRPEDGIVIGWEEIDIEQSAQP
jgi:hypothetical protein